MAEFTLHEVLVTSLSQVMNRSNTRSIRIMNDVAEHIAMETLYGDSLRLQQVLADFLLISINSTPNGGQVVIAATLTKEQLGKSVHLVNLELR
jgi:phytochrome A